ncbi:hypothetical protein KC878_01025 [Candidatus Saccharibacteria bacterium]|nr:hypothetical protein [Candidatus Saccharibacteria bacterium]MCB9821567.1 hypothetical protein [Candidatus Nomurabacteria bacterium]
MSRESGPIAVTNANTAYLLGVCPDTGEQCSFAPTISAEAKQQLANTLYVDTRRGVSALRCSGICQLKVVEARLAERTTQIDPETAA